MIRQAAELILAGASARSSTPAAASSRPGPPRRCGSWPSCCDIHVVTTLMARGAFPDDHPLCLGMPGMHGNYTAVTAMQESDLLIALGSRFDDRVTGKVDGFAPDAKIIHVDIDPAELGKVRRPDVRIVGDCRLVIEELVVAVTEASGGPESQPDRSAWKSTISGWQEKYPLTYEQSEPGELLKPQFVLETAAGQHPRRLHRGLGRRPAPDVDQPVLEVQPPLHLGQLRRAGHHGLLGAGGHRGQGRPARPHGLGRRRRRLLPDDRPGAGHRGQRAHPGQDRHPEQRLPRHGPPVAGDVLRGALLRGVPLARPARLRDVGRGHGLRRHAGRVARRGAARPSRRPTRSTTGRSSSTSAPTPARRCTRWSPPGTTNDEIVVDPTQGEGGH